MKTLNTKKPEISDFKITNPANSIINFAFFCYNYNDNFIVDCWQDYPVLAIHLKSKFKGDVLQFFYNLDFENQYILLDYIDKNYLAFKYLSDKLETENVREI